MKALNRKLWRDLWHLRGQALAVALIVAAGIASFVTARSAYDSLWTSHVEYYRDYRFADVFASLKRAPLAVASRIAAHPRGRGGGDARGPGGDPRRAGSGRGGLGAPHLGARTGVRRP